MENNETSELFNALTKAAAEAIWQHLKPRIIEEIDAAVKEIDIREEVESQISEIDFMDHIDTGQITDRVIDRLDLADAVREVMKDSTFTVKMD